MAEAASAGLVSVVGGESTGKTSLATALGERMPALVVPESLRGWVDRHGRVPLAGEQRGVMAAHHEAERSALRTAPGAGLRWVVSDSGPLMTAVYSIQYYDDPSLLAEALRWTAGGAAVVWCQDDFAWEPDPQRDGAHARTASQRILAEIFAAHPDLPMIAVSGPLEARVASVLDQTVLSRSVARRRDGNRSSASDR